MSRVMTNDNCEILIQEIYHLREKIKIATQIIKKYEPDLNESFFLHDLSVVDIEEYMHDLEQSL